jgi:tetratricopeptide (TPR) repeat protein
MKALKNIALFGFLVLITSTAVAQHPTKSDAHLAYKQGNLEEAKSLIDQVVTQEDYLQDPEAWLIRGYVYMDVFKEIDKADPLSASRSTALESLYNAIQYDAEKKNSKNAAEAFNYLTTTLYNDAARSLNNMNDEQAISLFNDFVKAERRLNPDKDLTEKTIEFKNALGTVYTKKIRQERDLKWFNKATDVYEDVLVMDPDNYGANYNMATLYYNRGVQNIFTISPENDIPSIREIQYASKEFFILSMPYMLKAHELRPERKETLIGLEGIYYSLQDTKKSEYYRSLYEKILEKEQQQQDK